MAKTGKAALFFILTVFLFSVISPVIQHADPYGIDMNSIKQPPSTSHPFGTDTKGRDIFWRVTAGGRLSIGIALTAAFISAAVGFAFGITAGYFGGKVDAALMAFVDFILSFPSLLLAIAISVVMPPGIYNVMIALAAVGWASFARLIRGHVLSVKTMPYIDAAKALGCGNLRILLLHIAPLCIPLSLVMMGIKLGGFILAEATLSFLGLGAQPPTPTWGSMISAHRGYVLTAPWMVLFPGMAITFTAFCFNLAGEALREKFELKDSRL
ncbi:MAG: ABC transporter permease [Nitrospirae bacterium]|nr:MAG: ABC transporter permease [Nitrospirota bacterium]